MSRQSIVDHIPGLRRYARALTADAWAADDLVQDTLERACGKWRLWLVGSDLRAWLFTLMHNIYANQVRSAVRRAGHATLVDLDVHAAELVAPAQAADLGLDLQHLPGTQRAVLLLRDVLEYSAAEAAEMLGTTTASVNSALQRAQQTVKDKMPGPSQAVELQALHPTSLDKLLRDLVEAWENRDVARLVGLLAEDARFTMPPLPAWFDGRASVAKIISQRMFATPRRLSPIWANGQPGFACYMKHPGTDTFLLGAVNLLAFRAGRIVGIHAFLDAAVHRRFNLKTEMF